MTVRLGTDFVDRFVALKKDGLTQNEINQLKGSIIPAKITTELGIKLNNEINKDKIIDSSEIKLLNIIGRSIKNEESSKVAKLIDPANSQISQLITNGLRNKNIISSNQSNDGVSKLSTKDKIAIAYQSYSEGISEENSKRGVSSMIKNMGIAAFTVKSFQFILNNSTQKVKTLLNVSAMGVMAKASYDETDRVTKQLSDAVYMINNPTNKEDLEKAGKILATLAFDIRDDGMTILAGSVASNTKLPQINIGFPKALKSQTVGGLSLSVTGNTPLNLKTKNKLSETKSNTISDSTIFAKKNNVTGENKYIQVKPKDIKALQEGGKVTVVTVKSIAEAEALVKKAFPDYKELEAFGTITEIDLNKFPSKIKSVIENRWRMKPTEINTINKSEQELLLKWGKENNKLKEAENIISDLKSRWGESKANFKKGGAWHIDYNIKDHPVRENGHGEYPHINVKNLDKHNLEIRIINK